MSLITRCTLRLLAALLVLAGILLLQKPVFGQYAPVPSATHALGHLNARVRSLSSILGDQG